MKAKITHEGSNFKPITVKIVLETKEEAQEFQVRMDLYYWELYSERPGWMDSINYFDTMSCMSGITNFRKVLHKALGSDSVKP